MYNKISIEKKRNSAHKGDMNFEPLPVDIMPNPVATFGNKENYSSSIYGGRGWQLLARSETDSLQWLEGIGLEMIRNYQTLTTGHDPYFEFANRLREKPPKLEEGEFKISRKDERKAEKELGKGDLHKEKPSMARRMGALANIGLGAVIAIGTAPISAVAAVDLFAVRAAEQKRLPNLVVLPPLGESPMPPGFSLLTLNCALSESEIMNGRNHLRGTETRLEGILGLIEEENPTVVFLQECFHTEILSRKLLHPLRKKGYQVVIPPKRARVLGFSGGIITLSRIPITQVGFFEFPFRSKVDQRAKKGGVIALIDGLCLVNTHMQASVEGTAQYKCDFRKEQFDGLLKFVEEKVGNMPILFAGDFNTGPKRSGSGDSLVYGRKEADYLSMEEGLLSKGFEELTVLNEEDLGTVIDTSSYTANHGFLEMAPLLKPNQPDHITVRGLGGAYKIVKITPMDWSGVLSDHVALKLEST